MIGTSRLAGPGDWQLSRVSRNVPNSVWVRVWAQVSGALLRCLCGRRMNIVRWQSRSVVFVLWKVNQVLVRLWARNRLPVVGGPLSEVSDDGLRKTGGWSFVGCMSDRECRLQGWRPNGRRREFRGVVNDLVESGCRAVVQAIKGKSVREDPVMCGVNSSRTVLK
jgi:hypothetical protein